MLLVLTLIGMSSISTTFFESKISGNDRFGATAFYAAKGGVEVGVSRLPDLTAYSGSLGSGDATYQSQRMSYLGLMGGAGQSAESVYQRYQIDTSGQSFGATKEIEVQVRLGPFPAGPNYNN